MNNRRSFRSIAEWMAYYFPNGLPATQKFLTLSHKAKQSELKIDAARKGEKS